MGEDHAALSDRNRKPLKASMMRHLTCEESDDHTEQSEASRRLLSALTILSISHSFALTAFLVVYIQGLSRQTEGPWPLSHVLEQKGKIWNATTHLN